MKAQFDNKVMSSFYLWLDHTLLKKGEAFTNHSSFFYPVDNLYQEFYTYGSPFKQFVSDTSISGAQVLSGVYVNGAFTRRGVSGFTGINYSMGQAYFSGVVSSPSTTLSGNYAIKDFNIFLTNDIEEKLLFETQFSVSKKTSQSPTGLPPESLSYPAIFLKNNGGSNEPAAFGGLDQTQMNVRAIVLSDSQFNLDAISSIFRDKERTFVPMLEEGQMPFNNIGDFKSGILYNYDSLTANKSESEQLFIDNVFISKAGGLSYAQKTNLNPDVFSMIIDFELSNFRSPRD